MKKVSKWLALLAVLALVLTFLLAGVVTAMAQEEEIENAGEIVYMQEGSIEALIWDDSANPDGALNEGEIYIDGLTVNLYIREPGEEEAWTLYGSMQSGPEDLDFQRPVPVWLNPYHEHGWVGWDLLPTNYTGIEYLEAGPYAYTDYKLELIPTEDWLPTNGTERFGRLWQTQIWPVQVYACALWYYPQNGDPDYRGYGVRMPPSTISGYIWEDRNADGKVSRREGYLRNWEVVLTVDGVPVATTRTDSNGYYEFTGLDPGMYDVWTKNVFLWKQVYPLFGFIVLRPNGERSYEKGHYFVWVMPGEDYPDCNFGQLRMTSIFAWITYTRWMLGLVLYWLGI